MPTYKYYIFNEPIKPSTLQITKTDIYDLGRSLCRCNYLHTRCLHHCPSCRSC